MKKEVGLIIISVIMGAFGQLFLKIGVNTLEVIEISVIGIVNLIFTPMVFLGLALYFASTITWLMALSKAELSFAYPFIASGYGIVAYFGWQFLGESISALRILGIITIIIGVGIVSISSKK